MYFCTNITYYKYYVIIYMFIHNVEKDKYGIIY